ncbi:hypothetical protein [Microcoleus sp. F4-D5]|uniref:hypothetical protein n=1 Tax=Microcoleus sp. F4-D5 TaxID=2818760 RepID=UPI002FD21C8C
MIPEIPKVSSKKPLRAYRIASEAGKWAAGVPGGIFLQKQSPLEGGGKTNLEVWEFYSAGRWNKRQKKQHLHLPSTTKTQVFSLKA